jgi:hypothetical protein
MRQTKPISAAETDAIGDFELRIENSQRDLPETREPETANEANVVDPEGETTNKVNLLKLEGAMTNKPNLVEAGTGIESTGTAAR